MTSWLPKEILDHLKHAGYVAIPKERVREFLYQQDVNAYEMMHHAHFKDAEKRELEDVVARRLAYGIGLSLLKEGFLRVQMDHLQANENGGFEVYRHRASVQVIVPR